MKIRDLLIRAYPRSWRDEFGPEFAGILANQRLNATAVADVLLSAALQHLRRDPWKLCGLILTLWTVGLMATASMGLMDRMALEVCYFVGQVSLFAAGAWTGLTCKLGRAMTASFKASLVPAAVVIVVSGFRMLFYLEHYHVDVGPGLYFEIGKTALLTILVSLLFGLAGASFARLVSYFRDPSQASS